MYSEEAGKIGEHTKLARFNMRLLTYLTYSV